MKKNFDFENSGINFECIDFNIDGLVRTKLQHAYYHYLMHQNTNYIDTMMVTKLLDEHN